MMLLSSVRPQPFIERHRVDGSVQLSGGDTADTYFDLRAALLCEDCSEAVVSWYREALAKVGMVAGPAPTLVGTGTFGAMLLARLTQRYRYRCLLWNPKGHGIEWSGDMPGEGQHVVIVDDVITTGGTLARLRAAVEQQGWIIDATIVAVDRREDES